MDHGLVKGPFLMPVHLDYVMDLHFGWPLVGAPQIPLQQLHWMLPHLQVWEWLVLGQVELREPMIVGMEMVPLYWQVKMVLVLQIILQVALMVLHITQFYPMYLQQQGMPSHIQQLLIYGLVVAKEQTHSQFHLMG